MNRRTRIDLIHKFDSERLEISGLELKKKTWRDIAYILFCLLLASALLYDAKNSQFDIISPIPDAKAEVVKIVKVFQPTPTPDPTQPSELESIVAYIARVFEPEGKHVVVKAINCFYSESGLRPDAKNQNTDDVGSTDWGIAQLNSYWHDLSEAEKTEVKANIDRAYEIYKGRGGNFSAWYGKGCK